MKMVKDSKFIELNKAPTTNKVINLDFDDKVLSLGFQLLI